MASKSYLIVCSEGSSDTLRRPLDSNIGAHIDPAQPISEFRLPLGSQTPKFGTFDNLIKLTDELAKFDSQTEGCLRRVERSYIETKETELEKQQVEQDADSHFEVYDSQKKALRVDNFLRQGWGWDEAKYPASRSLQGNLEFLLASVQKLDEECRNHGQAYAEIKAQKNSLTKKDGGSYPTRDLVDLLVPSAVAEGDFVETEHLTTVVVILARGQDVDFQKWYGNPEVRSIRMKDGKEEEHVDKIDPPQTVIPNSAKQFINLSDGAEDKDGNTVWRVVLFKSCKEKFQALARQNKFLVRDYEYNPSALKDLNEKRKDVEKDAEKKLQTLTKFCKLAWSDVFTAWLHIKAMRAFVESVLRYGIPAKDKFAGFIVCPRAGVTPALREALARALPGKGPAGDKADDADGEEYFPYVSLGFAPRAAQVSA